MRYINGHLIFPLCGLHNVFICCSQGIRIGLSNLICTFLALKHLSCLIKNEDVMRIHASCAQAWRAHGSGSGRRKNWSVSQNYPGRLNSFIHPYGRWWHPHMNKRLPNESQGQQGGERKGQGGVGKNAAKKTAGLEPIRPGEAPSTCTTRPPGRAPVTRWEIIIITVIYLRIRGWLWGQS